MSTTDIILCADNCINTAERELVAVSFHRLNRICNPDDFKLKEENKNHGYWRKLFGPIKDLGL